MRYLKTIDQTWLPSHDLTDHLIIRDNGLLDQLVHPQDGLSRGNLVFVLQNRPTQSDTQWRTKVAGDLCVWYVLDSTCCRFTQVLS